MEPFTMWDVIRLLNLTPPPNNRSAYDIACPHCDRGRGKHLNINLAKNVFRCPRCGISGGIFDLYALHTGINRDKVKEEMLRKLRGKDEGGAKYKPIQPPPLPEVHECDVADISTRDQVYRAMLSKLALAPDHMKNLLDRGLPEDAIAERQYRTSLVVGMKALAKSLMSNRLRLTGVPGFYRDDTGEWTFVETGRGILIPVRDVQGRIQGLQIRRDNVKKRKFRWVSSADRQDGCRAEGWIHIAGPIRGGVLLTEGPMKADVIHHLTGLTVIAVPGVNSLKHLEPVLLNLRESGVQQIMTCFDMDFLQNHHVQGAYAELISLLDQTGIAFGTYLWHPDYKGLDDYLWESCFEREQGVCASNADTILV